MRNSAHDAKSELLRQTSRSESKTQQETLKNLAGVKHVGVLP